MTDHAAMHAPPPTTLQKPPRWQRFISRRAWVLLGLCVMGASTAGISAYLPVWEHPLAWWLDLFTHWQWLYLLVGASCALWLLQSHRILPLLGLGILITATFIMTADSLPLADARRPDQGLRVVSANLYFNQPTPEALLQWIAQQNPDIVVLQEVSSAHITAIQQIFNDLHQTLYPREDPFGLAVLSRLPLIAQQYLDDAADTPVLRLLLDWHSHTIALSAVHPMPPISAHAHHRRSASLLREIAWGQTQASPLLMVGDLNATPWSVTLHHLAKAQHYRIADPVPTWPALFPVLRLDNILGSAHWESRHHRVGPALGSDHRPISAELFLR